VNQQEFIQMIAPAAQDFQRTSGAFASVTIAQACLETGYGAFIPEDEETGRCSYNLFGVKEFGDGPHVCCSTWEVEGGQRVTIKAKFRAYPSYTESIADHAAFLLQPRYVPVLQAATPLAAANQLHPCGYATDPEYGAKLAWIIQKFNLTQYDLTKGEGDDMSFLTEEQKKSLLEILPAPMPEWFHPVADKLSKLGAEWSGYKSPVVYESLAILDRAGVLDDALKQRGIK
jgi:flagellum-specific peptidoglycan hydrolase FlgJ